MESKFKTASYIYIIINNIITNESESYFEKMNIFLNKYI